MSKSVLNEIASGQLSGQYAHDVLIQKLKFEVRHQRSLANEDKCTQATQLLAITMMRPLKNQVYVAHNLIQIINS